MTPANDGGRVLYAIASPLEANALRPGALPEFWRLTPLGPGCDAVLTGVGKANAAGAVSRVLDPEAHIGVVSLGIGGALPGSGLHPGDLVVASDSHFSDEGLETPSGFVALTDLGFSPAIKGGSIAPFREWLEVLVALGARAVPVATISTCAGTDARARSIADRLGAGVEAMEGAAVGLVAARLGLRFCEVRVVSNTTGDREQQRWDMDQALDRLRAVFEALAGELC